MTTPALQRLRQALPEAHITLLTHEKLSALWQHHPDVDALVTYAPGESPWAVARLLRRNDFDTALVLPNSPRSALEVWLARVPRRIGYSRPWRDWFLTDKVATRPGHLSMRKRSVREISNSLLNASASTPHASHLTPLGPAHQLHEYLHLAAVLGANPAPLAPRLEITAAELRQVEETFLSGSRDNSGSAAGAPLVLLGLNPGAEFGLAKRWPAERFAAMAREVSQRVQNCAWLAFGGATDWKLCNEIVHRSGARITNLAGKTSLRELMALLKLCRVVVTNDTGPMHVAAALGTPVVVPFGSTSPALTGPGLPDDRRHHLLQSDAPCSPCFRRTCPIDFRCMNGINVLRVTEAILNAISQME
jgi:heptosyltransferase-2